MKKGVVVNPSLHSKNPLDFLKKHCAILVDNNYKTPSSMDEILTGQYIYISQSMPFHGAAIVVDNLGDFHLSMPKDFCQNLIKDNDYRFRAISSSGKEFNDILGASERIVFHKEHGIQHQLLCSNLGEPSWVNVTGMEVILEKSLFSKENNEANNNSNIGNAKKENSEFIDSFLKGFNHKISEPITSVNVKVADYREAKSHLNSMVRDLSQCIGHKEKMFWLTTTERMFFEYRNYSCKRATPDDNRLFEIAINKVSNAMEGCLEVISKPQEIRKKISIHDLPPESKRMLDLSKLKSKSNIGDPSP